MPLDKADLTRIGQTGVLAVVAVLALLLVLRPMVIRLTTNPVALADASAAAWRSRPGAPSGRQSLAGRLGRRLGGPLAAAATPALPAGDESMVRIGNIEGACVPPRCGRWPSSWTSTRKRAWP